MLRVLLVDDDWSTTKSVRLLLELWGHDVRVAHDGAEAVKAVSVSQPDVVLLDLALGGAPDGYEVAQQIRRQAGKQPTIVCFSGYGRDEDRRKSRAAGCDHHLLKPPDIDGLKRLLRGVEHGSAPAG